MTLYEVLISVVGPVPIDDSIGAVLLWVCGCILTVIVPLYAVFYVTRVMIDWGR